MIKAVRFILLTVVGSFAFIMFAVLYVQLLAPEWLEPEPIDDSIIFTELAREDASNDTRSRVSVTITTATPIGPHLAAIHEVIARRAVRSLGTEFDAIEITLVLNDAFQTGPYLLRYRYAADGMGWDADESWFAEVTRPSDPFPENSAEIFRAASVYLNETPEGDRNSADLVAAVHAKTKEADDDVIRLALRPSYETVQISDDPLAQDDD